MSSRLAASATCLVLATTACVAPPVEVRRWGLTEGAFEKVAVVPFRPWPIQARAEEALGGPGADAPQHVGGLISEELGAAGIEVVAADEVAQAVIGEQDPTGPFDAAAIAQVTAKRFGATSVLVGQVVRFRERSGDAMGSKSPASVAFEVTLYDAQGRKIRSAVFDETQKDLSANVWNAARYPGGGTRWLTADELARWGAQSAVEALVAP